MLETLRHENPKSTNIQNVFFHRRYFVGILFSKKMLPLAV